MSLKLRKGCFGLVGRRTTVDDRNYTLPGFWYTNSCGTCIINSMSPGSCLWSSLKQATPAHLSTLTKRGCFATSISSKRAPQLELKVLVGEVRKRPTRQRPHVVPARLFGKCVPSGRDFPNLCGFGSGLAATLQTLSHAASILAPWISHLWPSGVIHTSRSSSPMQQMMHPGSPQHRQPTHPAAMVSCPVYLS